MLITCPKWTATYKVDQLINLPPSMSVFDLWFHKMLLMYTQLQTPHPPPFPKNKQRKKKGGVFGFNLKDVY